MIPILFSKDETTFASNGLGRLRDVVEATVVEERNGIYELEFSYPVTGAHYDEIQVGRIVGVTHDESGDLQPFDIVSYTRPIDGVVTFHCTHISYRQSYLAVKGRNVNSLADAFTWISSAAEPDNPFTYWTDKTSVGYLGAADNIPRSVKSVLGGTEGSILDAYGGEYEWDRWTVKLHANRGRYRGYSIRYGVNMLDYNEELSIEGSYSSCMPYWTDGTSSVSAWRIESDYSTITGRGECVPLDLSQNFESQPSVSQLIAAARTYMAANTTFLPSQNITVSFVRPHELGYEELKPLFECNLCDTIDVIFPDYDVKRQYKIVKTTWDVLRDRYESMELGDLSVTLAEALGVSSEKEAKNNILNSIYPIGSVYISTNYVSPSLLFGGTWVQIKGRFLLGTGTPDANTDATFGNMSGTSYNVSAKSKGGQDYHTLTANEMPSHYHNSSANGYSIKYITGTSGTSYGVWGGYDGAYATGSSGGDQAHNNMPPYFAVYMWERTA